MTPEGVGAIGRLGAEDDLDAATGVLLDAFAEEANARLGPDYARAWLRSFANRPGGDSCLLGARHEGEISGFAAGVDEAGLAAHYRALRGVAARALIRRPWLLVDPAILRMMARRLHGGGAANSPIACWYLPLIGVASRAQGHGLGAALLAAFEAEGRRRDARRAALQVRDDNQRAIRLYEAAGWRSVGGMSHGRRRYEKTL